MPLRAALVACAAVVASACATPAPPAALVPVPLDDPQMRVALDKFTREGRLRQSLRAVGRLKLDSPHGRGGVREVILVERPDRFRLESLNMLGQSVVLLASDGDRFSWYESGQLESGRVHPGLLNERLGLELDPSEAIAAFLVALPGGDGAPRAAYRSADQTVIQLDRWRLHLRPGGDLAALEALDGAGGVRWRATYADWKAVPGGRYPGSLELDFPAARTSAKLELREVELNAALDPGLFRGPQ